MTKRRLLVDIDQVIFPFNDALAEHCNAIRGTELVGADFTSFAFHHVIGCTYDDGVAVIKEVLGADHRDRPPLPGVLEVLPALAEIFDPIGCTSRNPEFRDATAAYICHWLPGVFSDVVATGNRDDGGPFVPKSAMCAAYEAAAIIDDSPATVIDCIGRAGVSGYVFGSYPWNEVFDGNSGAVRMPDWQTGYNQLRAA